MKLFAQHGFSDGFKTVEGLRKELIDGVIFSPRDITPEKLRLINSQNQPRFLNGSLTRNITLL